MPSSSLLEESVYMLLLLLLLLPLHHPLPLLQGSVIQLDVEGTGFLYRQVRNMVALLIQIGKEGVPTDMVGMILESRDRRELAKYTSMSAPPQGLCLVSVNYNQDHLRLPELGYPAVSFGRHQTISKSGWSVVI
ncbi:tRNA pseudouridine synthase A [Linum perenne]